MSSCARCGIARLIQRHGRENVIEVIHAKKPSGWTSYEICVLEPPDATREAGNIYVTLDNQVYRVVSVVFSEQHSLDDDCELVWNKRNTRQTYRDNPTLYGFPTGRFRAVPPRMAG